MCKPPVNTEWISRCIDSIPALISSVLSGYYLNISGVNDK